MLTADCAGYFVCEQFTQNNAWFTILPVGSVCLFSRLIIRINTEVNFYRRNKWLCPFPRLTSAKRSPLWRVVKFFFLGVPPHSRFKILASSRVLSPFYITICIKSWNIFLLIYSSNWIFTARCYAQRGCATVCRPSVRLSVRNVWVPWSHRLEFFENTFTTE